MAKTLPSKKSSVASSARSRNSTRVRRARGTRILVVASTSAQRAKLARSVAAELDRDLHQVDLAALQSRYIGETEKNLESLFNSTERKGSILFFDEADALFGKRTSVKDANDRYANQEVSYLLERIEESRGVIVLATNSTRNIDPSWMRRLGFALKLTEPKAKEGRAKASRAPAGR